MKPGRVSKTREGAFPLARSRCCPIVRRRIWRSRRRRACSRPWPAPAGGALRRGAPTPWPSRATALAFAVDADRVLHSHGLHPLHRQDPGFFPGGGNAHISHRVLHVQLVSKIGRGLGRMLGLNEDLIEAIALAHDLGHPPFGHDGERLFEPQEMPWSTAWGPFHATQPAVGALPGAPGAGRARAQPEPTGLGRSAGPTTARATPPGWRPSGTRAS